MTYGRKITTLSGNLLFIGRQVAAITSESLSGKMSGSRSTSRHTFHDIGKSVPKEVVSTKEGKI